MNLKTPITNFPELKAKINFREQLSLRLCNAQIENNDALKVIQSRDTPDSFHFADPPYIGSNQGHYSGYEEKDFVQLLQLLGTIEGKFMLTMYPHNVLDEYIKKFDWNVHELEKTITVSKANRRKQKELIVTNY